MDTLKKAVADGVYPEEMGERYKDYWKGQFAVVLDKNGRLIGEPYPVTANLSAEVKVGIEDDSITKGRKNIVARSDSGIFGSKDAVALLICEVPKDFAKVELVKMEDKKSIVDTATSSIRNLKTTK